MAWATFWAIFSQTHLVTLLTIVGLAPALVFATVSFCSDGQLVAILLLLFF
jgi:hypothetical protein